MISAQESPVPLPKFQMAPRFKILMSSGSKKGTQIFFTQKVPASESPPGSPMGPIWRERERVTYRAFLCLLNISFYLSLSPLKVSLL